MPLPWPARLLLAVVAGLLAAWASHGQWFWQQDEAIYDRYVANRHYAPDPSLLIVAIDERSLQQLGRLPWPRAVHARLLDRLTAAGTDRVALDLPLTESDRQQGQDAELAAAIRRHGRVVLPVRAVPARGDRMADALLPLPLFTASGATLAHAELAPDADGVIRGLYLHAGIGSPRWPAVGLALAHPPGDAAAQAPAIRTEQDRPWQWMQEGYVRVPLAGPAGTVPQVSYVDVLHGRIDRLLLQGRRVLVGVTAVGAAPHLSVHHPARSSMSRVEYQANVTSNLLQQQMLRALPDAWQAAIAALLAAACVLLLCRGRSARVLALGAGLLLPPLVSWGMLRVGNLWWPPATVLGSVLLAAAICATSGTIAWRRQSRVDGLTGLANRRRFDHVLQQEIDAGLRTGHPLSVVLIDVAPAPAPRDVQRTALDEHAQVAVAVAVAQLVAAHARRPRDLPARLGPDAFAMVLPDTPAAGARQVVEGLLSDALLLNSEAPGGAGAAPRLAMGVCCRRVDATTSAPALLSCAHAALQQARQAGREGYVLVGEG